MTPIEKVAGERPRPCFATCRLSAVVTVVRLMFIFDVLPPDWKQWLSSPALASVLTSPIHTLQHVREGKAIRSLTAPHRFVDAYHGDQVHLPPLLLAVLEPITAFHHPSYPYYMQRVLLGILLLFVDFMISWTLERIGLELIKREMDEPWEEDLQVRLPEKIRPKLSHIYEISNKQNPIGKDDDPLFRMKDMPFLSAGLYYASPVSVLASHACGSFQNLKALIILTAILHSLDPSGSIVIASFSLSIASYMDLHSLAFIVPAVLFVAQRRKRYDWFILLFFLWSICLQGLSFLLVGSKLYPGVIQSSHGSIFGLHGITPSLSLMWYFHMELFERFNLYFTIVLGALPYLLVLPTSLRLHRYPIVLVTVFWFLWTIFRPSGTLFDLNVGLCLMRFSPRSLARMGVIVSLVCICGLAVPVVLYIVDFWMWLETNTGEANYLFFQCVAYNVFVSLLFLEFCGASLRRDKSLRLTAHHGVVGSSGQAVS